MLRALQKSVSTFARGAIAFPLPRPTKEPLAHAGGGEDDLLVREGDAADLLLLPERCSVRAAALDPCFSRVTIRSGCVVARREATTEFADTAGYLKSSSMLERRVLQGIGVLIGVAASQVGMKAAARWANVA